MIRIALPKGTSHGNSLKLIQSFSSEEIDARKLNFHSGADINFILSKHRDIPRLVDRESIDIGVTGHDWLIESGIEFSIYGTLDWCESRISLISPVGITNLGRTDITCATEYPEFAKKVFPPECIYKISGASEGLIPHIFDCAVDCVETGDTIRRHNLYEEKIIFKSSIVIFGKKRLNRDKEAIVNKILDGKD